MVWSDPPGGGPAEQELLHRIFLRISFTICSFSCTKCTQMLSLKIFCEYLRHFAHFMHQRVCTQMLSLRFFANVSGNLLISWHQRGLHKNVVIEIFCKFLGEFATKGSRAAGLEEEPCMRRFLLISIFLCFLEENCPNQATHLHTTGGRGAPGCPTTGGEEQLSSKMCKPTTLPRGGGRAAGPYIYDHI